MLKVPRPEHPRPDFERSNWINLNGEWQFEIDIGKSGFEKGWATGRDFGQKIIVPFPPESVLSGLGVTDFMESVWYRRFFGLPESWLDKRVLLHFGAVDYETKVYVNGRQVVQHRGGYTPFTCDISDAVRVGDNELVVWARDECRSKLQASGKQSHRLESYGCFYTRVTGIWQTVWLESVPHIYVQSFRLTTDPNHGKVFVRACVVGRGKRFSLSMMASEGREAIAEIDGTFYRSPAELVLALPSSRVWSPQDPYLYRLRLQLSSGDNLVDTVDSYFGLRDIHVVDNRLLLNNKTRFLRLVLDQGYYREGVYTAPSDDALKHDVEISKAMGFDGARLHQKIFEPRFLYWADNLGYVVVEEFPDWGADISQSSAREALLDEWIEVVQRDFNHPCVIVWTPFNEKTFAIGDQCADFIRRIVRLTRLSDPTRPIIDSSGRTHVETDIYDVHDYEQNGDRFRSHYADLEGPTAKAWDQTTSFDRRALPAIFQRNAPYKGQPFMVSEYGGTWWQPEEPHAKSWGYGERPKSAEELTARYKVLTECLLLNPAISAFCYTQLYDIEQETNGLHTYDRRPKIEARIIRDINKQEAAIEKMHRNKEKNRR